MKTDKKDQTPIIWKTTYDALKKRWIIGFILANLFYLMIIALMGWFFIQDRKAREFFILQGEELDTLKTGAAIRPPPRNDTAPYSSADAGPAPAEARGARAARSQPGQ